MPKIDARKLRRVRFHTASVDSGPSPRQEMTCKGIKKLRAGAGTVELSPLPRGESHCATGRGDEVGRWCDTNCTRAMDSAERWAYGEQLKRKLENW